MVRSLSVRQLLFKTSLTLCTFPTGLWLDDCLWENFFTGELIVGRHGLVLGYCNQYCDACSLSFPPRSNCVDMKIGRLALGTGPVLGDRCGRFSCNQTLVSCLRVVKTMKTFFSLSPRSNVQILHSVEYQEAACMFGVSGWSVLGLWQGSPCLREATPASGNYTGWPGTRTLPAVC